MSLGVDLSDSTLEASLNCENMLSTKKPRRREPGLLETEAEKIARPQPVSKVWKMAVVRAIYNVPSYLYLIASRLLGWGYMLKLSVSSSQIRGL